MGRRRPALSPRAVALVVLAGAGVVVLSLAILSARFLASAGAESPALPPSIADASSDASFSAALRDEDTGLPALPEESAPVTPLAAARPERTDVAGPSAQGKPVKFSVLAFTTTGESLKAGLELPGVRLPFAVVASDAPLDPGSLHAQGTDRGRYHPRKNGPLPNGLLGQIEIERPVTRYVSLVLRHLVLDSVEVPELSDRVRFTVDVPYLKSQLGEVQLEVADAQTGELLEVGRRQSFAPARFVTVQLTGRDPWTGRAFSNSPGQFLDKWARFRHVPPGPMVLTLEAAGYERRVLEIEVPAGRGLDLGTLSLARWATITGRIVDPPGPMEISIFNSGSGSWLASRTPICTGTSREDGFFVLSALGRDQYLLRARSLDQSGLHLALLPVDTRAGDVADLRVELATARPVTFLLASGLVADLQLSRADGTIIATWLAADRPQSYKTPLVPGTYRLVVARDGRVVEERTVEVNERTSVIDVAR